MEVRRSMVAESGARSVSELGRCHLPFQDWLSCAEELLVMHIDSKATWLRIWRTDHYGRDQKLQREAYPRGAKRATPGFHQPSPLQLLTRISLNDAFGRRGDAFTCGDFPSPHSSVYCSLGKTVGCVRNIASRYFQLSSIDVRLVLKPHPGCCFQKRTSLASSSIARLRDIAHPPSTRWPTPRVHLSITDFPNISVICFGGGATLPVGSPSTKIGRMFTRPS
ncbi:hypothetical protein LZ32DRAFT_84982 [Colletotrichum eremochloae]|nr:hypothetical protein LZ32DRAFT_84982 [Colletotrichum eremochloae]